MVQMKVRSRRRRRRNIVYELYIPHGSDERIQKNSTENIELITLYPTWFR